MWCGGRKRPREKRKGRGRENAIARERGRRKEIEIENVTALEIKIEKENAIERGNGTEIENADIEVLPGYLYYFNLFIY